MLATLKGLIVVVLVGVLVGVLFGACKRIGQQRLHVVYIVDMTASTIEDARAKAFDGIQQPFDNGFVRRGDSITIIPITGDALTESQGSILRFEISPKRSAYDDDLRALSEEVTDKLQKLRDSAAAKPYLYSDIIGAARIAGEEFSTDGPDVQRLLVVLSDFVEDETQLNFKTSSMVVNEKSAKEAAKKIVSGEQSFRAAKVYLGWLQSTDLKRMPTQRRDAVRTFWTEYFKQEGAKSIHVCSDGPGQLPKFIAE